MLQHAVVRDWGLVKVPRGSSSYNRECREAALGPSRPTVRWCDASEVPRTADDRDAAGWAKPLGAPACRAAAAGPVGGALVGDPVARYAGRDRVQVHPRPAAVGQGHDFPAVPVRMAFQPVHPGQLLAGHADQLAFDPGAAAAVDGGDLGVQQAKRRGAAGRAVVDRVRDQPVVALARLQRAVDQRQRTAAHGGERGVVTGGSWAACHPWVSRVCGSIVVCRLPSAVGRRGSRDADLPGPLLTWNRAT